MKSSGDFYVFEKWQVAPSYAFGGRNKEGVVPLADREAYRQVYEDLIRSAREAVSASEFAADLVIRPKPYSRDRGSRGHRPIDLYVSICGATAGIVGWYPQVYAIASRRGLELGFAASISEDNYFDANAKERNRTIVPFINSKLPAPDDSLTVELERVLAEQGGWHFNAKTRLEPRHRGFDAFASLGALFRYLKMQGAATGGGTVCRLFAAPDLPRLDLAAELRNALDTFAPLIGRCAPTLWDAQVRMGQTTLESLRGEAFDPSSVEDGRIKILMAVARRQGQSKFRASLLEAYGAQCAISRTKIVDVLQAAHITPYRGPETNHVTNGLLLRADLHTLFDLGLVRINPNSLRVSVSPALKDSSYWAFDGAEIYLPEKVSMRPSATALDVHFSTSSGRVS